MEYLWYLQRGRVFQDSVLLQFAPMAIDWTAAIHYASLVKVAEGVAPGGGYDGATAALIASAGYTFLETLYGDDLSTDIDPHIGDIVTFGFLAVSGSKELVAAIRGTNTILEWLHDGSFLMVRCPVNGISALTEDGFTSVYRSLRIGRANNSPCAKDSIQSYLATGAAASVTICGHSLGAALATLLAADVALNTSYRAPASYTFASPRTGDHLFARAYNTAVPATYRVANRQDLVTKLPPPLPLPYEHVNSEYELVPAMNTIDPTIACMHHLTTYLYLMDQQAQTGMFSLDPDCVSKGPEKI